MLHLVHELCPPLLVPELHGTLADLARRGCRNKFPSYPVAGELAQQCLEGLARAHQCRVVHRDLSPINILVDLGHCANTGRMQLIVKLADFSRARVLPVEGASNHTGMEQRQGPENACHDHSSGDTAILRSGASAWSARG